MLVNRWNPLSNLWGDMDRLRSEVNELVHRFGVGDAGGRGLALAFPPVNVWEEENTLFAEAELPGMSLDKLEIYVTEGNQLTVQGERLPVDARSGVWHRQERGFGRFSRVISLPVQVDAEKVEAKLENGILHITLPKAEAAKPRRITIKAH